MISLEYSIYCLSPNTETLTHTKVNRCGCSRNVQRFSLSCVRHKGIKPWWINQKKVGAASRTKAHVKANLLVFTGQFLEIKYTNVVFVSSFLSYFPLALFFNAPSGLVVSLWSHEINVDPVVLDESIYVCDIPVLSLRLCARMFWREYAHNRVLASPIPLVIQIHRLFSRAKNSLRRLPSHTF